MPFPLALSRMVVLSFIVITDTTSLVLSAIAFHGGTGGAFQALAVSFDTLSLLSITGCLCHQFVSHDEEASNTGNMCLFGACGLLSFALVVLLTVHARQDRGMGLCNDFANAGRPCVPAGVQLGIAYASLVLVVVGFIISWVDKFPGAVKVIPRYPNTKAPSSHFAAYAHELDGNYTHPPVKIPSRSRNNPKWSDVPLGC